jgi:DNA helicase II / ATP-dependent DNA helicase PcrA
MPLPTLRRVAPATATPDPFAALNPQQRAAVEHGLERGAEPAAPLLVIAGAGSGKTLTLAARAARLVLAGADPQRLLLLTFSRRAAAEMERRVGRMLHQALGLGATTAPPALPWAGTFHAIGARLLREHAARVGLPDDFTVLDRGDAEDLLGLVRQRLALGDATKKRFPTKATCLAIYSRAVNSREPLGRVLGKHYPWCAEWAAELKRLFRGYVAEKQQQHALDFDDLLLGVAQMLTEAPALRDALDARFRHVLVDEYQDTNRLQAAVLLALKPTGAGLTVVGDDAQAIYAFRAAEVRNILDFPAAFAPPARVITLERNYRSTDAILEASNRVIALSPERYAKALWSEAPASQRPALVTVADEAAQAAWVADEVLRQRESGIALRAQAVLFRSSHHSAALELELARRNIPFVKFGGLAFLDATHVKDVLALLRWAQNPRARMAALRVAQLVAGVGAASAARLVEAMAAAPDPVAALHGFRAPPAAAPGWQAFLATYDTLHRNHAGWPAEMALVEAWYRPQLERLHDDAAMRGRDVSQLAVLAAEAPSRERFLTDLTLDPPAAASDEAGAPLVDEDYLILSTIHSAKGQEWSAVHVLNVVDGCIPSDMATGDAVAIEEERRLLYVAMTRAKRQLHLVVPLRFHVTQQRAFGDHHLYAALTRFIPDDVAACFARIAGGGSPTLPDRCATDVRADEVRPGEDEPLPRGAPVHATDGAAPHCDLAASMRAAWE